MVPQQCHHTRTYVMCLKSGGSAWTCHRTRAARIQSRPRTYSLGPPGNSVQLPGSSSDCRRLANRASARLGMSAGGLQNCSKAAYRMSGAHIRYGPPRPTARGRPDCQGDSAAWIGGLGRSSATESSSNGCCLVFCTTTAPETGSYPRMLCSRAASAEEADWRILRHLAGSYRVSGSPERPTPRGEFTRSGAPTE